MATPRSTTDENSFVPVQFQKNTGRNGGKLKPQDKVHAHKTKYTLTRTVTHEQHSFWPNLL